MGHAVFYHLTRSGVDQVIDMILPRALGAGWRVMLRGTDRDRLERLDARLWLEPEDGFLPHGLEGGPQDADQPVLLGLGPAVNGAQGVVLLDGAQPLAGEENLERLWVLFDAQDEIAMQGARALWQRLTGAGMAAQYWSEDSGRWELKQERPARSAP